METIKTEKMKREIMDSDEKADNKLFMRYDVIVETKNVNMNLEPSYSIREVYYDEDRNPQYYSKDPVIPDFNNLDEYCKFIVDTLRPVWYWGGSRFPEEFPVEATDNLKEIREGLQTK